MKKEPKILDLDFVMITFSSLLQKGSDERYSVNFVAEDEDLHDYLISNGIRKHVSEQYPDGLFCAKSTNRPMILPIEPDFEDFKTISECLSIVNNLGIPDRFLFEELDVVVVAQVYDWEFRGQEGKSLCLKEIRVSPDELKERIMNLPSRNFSSPE